MIASINIGTNLSYLTAIVPSSLVVVMPGSPSASTCCAITPVSDIPSIYGKLSEILSDFQLNVYPVINPTLLSAFGITTKFSLRFSSDDAKAIISELTALISPLTVKDPFMIAISSIVVVPQAESITRLPEPGFVSISLSLHC